MSLRGDLTELQLTDLVEMMSLGAKSGIISLYEPGGAHTGSLAFSEGLLVEATYGRFTGETAFYALLGLRAGSFLVDSGARPTSTSGGLSTQSLLMEGTRRLDEVRQLRSRRPASLGLLLAAAGHPHSETEAQIIAYVGIAPRTVGEVVWHMASSGQADEYGALAAVDALLQRGLLADVRTQAHTPTPQAKLEP